MSIDLKSTLTKLWPPVYYFSMKKVQRLIYVSKVIHKINNCPQLKETNTETLELTVFGLGLNNIRKTEKSAIRQPV